MARRHFQSRTAASPGCGVSVAHASASASAPSEGVSAPSAPFSPSSGRAGAASARWSNARLTACGRGKRTPSKGSRGHQKGIYRSSLDA
eukprot:3178882-Pyramimonas_sp.AAC.1